MKRVIGVRRSGLVGSSSALTAREPQNLHSSSSPSRPKRSSPANGCWKPEIARTGPVLVYVDLGRQRATVYRTRTGSAFRPSRRARMDMRPRPGFHDPRGEQGASFQDLRRCLHALSAATDLAGVAMHAGNLPGFLRAMVFVCRWNREEALRGCDGRHGSHRRRPRRSGQASGTRACLPRRWPASRRRRRQCLRPKAMYLKLPRRSERAGVDHHFDRGPASRRSSQRRRDRARARMFSSRMARGQVMTFAGGADKSGSRSVYPTSPANKRKSSVPSGSNRCTCRPLSFRTCGP